MSVDDDQHAQARAAIRLVTRVTGRPYTMAQFVRDAFRAHLDTIWQEYNNGRPEKPDTTPLPPGR